MNIDKIERAAIVAARKSTHKTFNIGAVLVAHGSIVATSCNIGGAMADGLGLKYSTHAEARILAKPPAIAKSHAELYVLRLAKSGKISMAKPCKSCRGWLVARNVSAAYYTDENGQWQRLEL